MEFLLHFGLRKIGLPLILVEFQGVNLALLLDTGADKNYLDKRVYTHFKEHIEKSDETDTLTGLDGKVHHIEKVKMTFTFEGAEYNTEFGFLPEENGFARIQEESEIQIHGVLGCFFFLEHKWIIDFDNIKVYSNATKEKSCQGLRLFV